MAAGRRDLLSGVLDATPEQRAAMERSAVTALAGIHEITPDAHDLSFLEADAPGATSLEVSE